jgi:hypothetical protein
MVICLIIFYLTSVLISLAAHAKVSYEPDEKVIKRWTIFVLFLPVVNIFFLINILMIEISDKNHKIESLKIDKSYLSNHNYLLNVQLERVKKENITPFKFLS